MRYYLLGAFDTMASNMARVFQSLPLASFFSAVAAYMLPMWEVLAVIVAAVFIDLSLGLAASRKNKIPWNSRRLRLTGAKLFGYLALVLLAYAAERAFGVEWLASHKLIGGFLCLVESISIMENLAIISEKPVFITLLKLVRGRAKDKYGAIADDIREDKQAREEIKRLKEQLAKKDEEL